MLSRGDQLRGGDEHDGIHPENGGSSLRTAGAGRCSWRRRNSEGLAVAIDAGEEPLILDGRAA